MVHGKRLLLLHKLIGMIKNVFYTLQTNLYLQKIIMGLDIRKPQEEMQIEQPKLKSENGQQLYDVVETDDGRFEAFLPALYNTEKEYILGTSSKQFDSREEAEEAIELAKERSKIRFERMSLEKSFTKYFFRIDEVEDGKFKVTTPGLVDLKNGSYVGTTSRLFETWNEAKDFYLKKLEDESLLSKGSILKVKTGETEEVAFSAFDSFNPRVAPAEKSREIPLSVQTYILHRQKMVGEDPSASTYQETIKQEGWEEKIYEFISLYLKKDGQKIKKDLGITYLDSITPRQAAELTTQLVVELTKYKLSDIGEERGSDMSASKKTKADESTVLDLLNEGMVNKGKSDWEGNGVCRNFASMAKAVFESLKANQTRFNRLQDTYCLYDRGKDEFDPKRENKNVIELGGFGHAWNTFVTVSENEANATIVDTTWAKTNLDTGKVEGLDHTLLRMEPMIHQIAVDLPEDAPDRQSQLNHIFSYYQLKMEGVSQSEHDIISIDQLDDNQKVYYKEVAEKTFRDTHDLSQVSDEQLIQSGILLVTDVLKKKKQKKENQFFSSRVVDILKKQKDIPKISPDLLSVVAEEYKTLAKEADTHEIETLWRISISNPEFAFNDILKNYLKDKSLTNYHSREFIFASDELQLAIFEQIKTHAKFDEFIKDSPSFKIRMREVLPELFIGFYPGSNESDAKELTYLVEKSRFLRYTHLLDARQPTQKNVDMFFTNAKKTLQEMNSTLYVQIVGVLDDYELVKKYDSLYQQLKAS